MEKIPNNSKSEFAEDPQSTNQSELVSTDMATVEGVSKFKYEDDIEIPKTLLSSPPKLSEGLAKHVINKFPADSFFPENIAGTLVHGTSIHSIRPTWLAEGKHRTGYTGRGTEGLHNEGKPVRGIFHVIGDYTQLDKEGFNHIESDTNMRQPGFSNFPIFLVLGKSKHISDRERSYISEASHGGTISGMTASNAHLYDSEKRMVGLDAVVLAADESISLKTRIDMYKKEVAEIHSKRESWGLEKTQWIPESLFSKNIKLVNMRMRNFEFPHKQDDQRLIASEFVEYLKLKFNRLEENRRERENPKLTVNTDKEREMEILRNIQNTVENFVEKGDYLDISIDKSYEHGKSIGYFYNQFIRYYIWHKLLPSPDEYLEELEGLINKYEKILTRSRDEDLYEVARTDEEGKEIYLSLRQEANYIAHCMVSGVDKSKIVPIYDWDGNLLWPTEKDIIKKKGL